MCTQSLQRTTCRILSEGSVTEGEPGGTEKCQGEMEGPHGAEHAVKLLADDVQDHQKLCSTLNLTNRHKRFLS